MAKEKEPESLVDSKCLEALAKIGMDRAAIQLARQAEQFGAATISTTLGFLSEDDEADATFIAKLTVTVERVV